ncbi:MULTISPECIES: DUF502 domain-containing protein [unclassified Hwanghaeella]|jgi:uncharacterized membrane protein|uniref:DUF502 domain-containing protein n=1 Tax=unclassified Hwanghaeella TaxID=2605944 RepID=UPI0026961A47|tara:strand:- start:2579 stop:3301 length:723 start_codon:yes stop_codon:yes gene_type:complete
MESEGSNMPEPEKTPAPSEQTSKLGIFARLRAYFFAGVLVTAPIAITIALAVWIIGYIDDQIVPLIPQRYNPDTYFQQYLGVDFGLPGLGVLVLILAITLIGAFTAGLVGRWIVRFGEKLLDRMPIIRSLYKLTKQIFQTVLQNQSNAFRQAVLVEYPRPGLWAIAFVTAETQGELHELLQRDTVNVFLPTTPNPTSGFLLFVPKEDIKILNMPVEDAVKLVISAGIVHPGDDLAGIDLK